MTPAQRNAKKAMNLHHKQGYSLKEAWAMVKGGKSNPRKRKNTAKRKNFHHNPRKRRNGRYMTKAQWEQSFKENILPFVIQREMEYGSRYPDRPMRREAWNNAVDADIQDGILSERAYDWSHPAWLETYGFRKALAEQKKRDRYGYSNPRKRRNALSKQANPRRRRNSSDDIAIREILLTVTNDGNFYNQVLQPNVKNLGRHMYRGNFSRARAMDSFLRIANLADKFYAFNYGTRSRGVRYFGKQKGFILSVADRKKLAAELLEDQYEAIEYIADLMQAGTKYKDLNNNPRKRRNALPKSKNPRKRRNAPRKRRNTKRRR